MNNYEVCAQWVQDHSPPKGARILDYGCGKGEIVEALRSRGFEALGCDVYYEGGDYSSGVDKKLLGGIIRRMEGDKIPFPDDSFDYVINNQVMEHVKDMDSVLKEIHRVLKPGGQVLSLFGDKTMWTEGHCGIPFLHRFRRGSRLRIYYAAVLRLFGLGYHTAGKSVMRWSQDFCDWLDKWCYYRSLGEIEGAYDKYFRDRQYIEVSWLHQRLESRACMVSWLPEAVQRFAYRKRAGMVFVMEKSSA